MCSSARSQQSNDTIRWAIKSWPDFFFLSRSFHSDICTEQLQFPFKLSIFLSFAFLGKWKPNDYPFVDNIRAIYLTLEKLIQPEETQVNGIVILVDYGGVGLSQASNPGPLLAKKVVGILQVRHCKRD